MSGVCNIEKLKAVMDGKRISVEQLCAALRMDKSTYYRKIKNQGRGFTVEEVHGICQALNLTSEEATLIFFNSTVA